MRVKWHSKMSKPRKLPGGGAMGASLGNWEFLSQTNDNADCVPEDDRFKFVDDLSTLEVINLLTVGLSSVFMKSHVPSDIPTHGQVIETSKLKSQAYLDQINEDGYFWKICFEIFGFIQLSKNNRSNYPHLCFNIYMLKQRCG